MRTREVLFVLFVILCSLIINWVARHQGCDGFDWEYESYCYFDEVKELKNKAETFLKQKKLYDFLLYLELNLSGKPLVYVISFDKITKMLEGYSGANVTSICRKACNIPFLEAIKTGEERNVEMRDIFRFIHETKPSISRKDLKRFEQFALYK